jgi:hypothetical protein
MYWILNIRKSNAFNYFISSSLIDFIFNKSNKTNADKKSDVESAKHEFAFDNPYFKEDDTIDGVKKDTTILLEGTNYLIMSLKLT